MVRKVISGGQTGVDRAALDAAMEAGIPCGGWCPRGRKAEDGTIPEKYPLEETESSDYVVRTQCNVRDSDATMVLNAGTLDGGTAETVYVAQQMGKPCLLVNLDDRANVALVVAWMREHNVSVLNVAGPRATKCPGLYTDALAFLRRVLIDCM